MGCGDACPYYPGTRYVDCALDESAGQPLAAVLGLAEVVRGSVMGGSHGGT